MTSNISFVHNTYSIEDQKTAIEGESQELIDMLQRIVQNAGALLEVRNCSIALLDSFGTALVTMAALHRNDRKLRHTRFRMNEGVAGWVAHHKEPLVINNTSLDSRFKRLGNMPIGSIMCVPLIENNTFIGTLTATSAEPEAFSTKKAQMMTILADQALLAITHARHAENAQQQARQLEMVLDLARGITTQLEPEVLHQTILRDLLKLVTCERAALYGYHERTQELIPLAETHLASTNADTVRANDPVLVVRTKNLSLSKVSLHDAQSILAWAALHRHPMISAPVARSQEASEQPLKEDARFARIAAPLLSKNVLYGVLFLQRQEAFTSEELRIVRNISNIAAAALENVTLVHHVRADQAQLRAILAASSDGIALLEGNGCFLEANPAFGRILGMESARIVGMECIELFGYEQENQELARMYKALQQEEPLPYIELDLAVQDIPRSIGLSITPVKTANGPLYLLVARDITAMREVTRMKSQFISMITHELRSPLNAINGYLDLALEGIAGELNEQLHEFLQRARSGSEHLYALLEDLLLISRVDAGQWKLSREIIDLTEVIENAVEELELTASDSGLVINTAIANREHIAALYADPLRLQQVLRNLLSNALRHTAAGGQITVSTQVTDNTYQGISKEHSRVLLLQVSDTGVGIAPEHLERIFDRFYQVPAATMSRKGQGLGLAIVKMVVEAHSGLVSVESTPNQGSTFTCILPCLLS